MNIAGHRQRFVGFAGVLCLLAEMLLLAGCIQQGTLLGVQRIYEKPFRNWTSEECYAVMQSYASNNFWHAEQPARVMVFSCMPRFLLAYNWQRVRAHALTIREFDENADRQARACFGGSFDADHGEFLNSRGMFIHGLVQLDSVLFILTLENNSGMFPVVSHFKTRLSLAAGGKVLAVPTNVTGYDGDYLMRDQTYNVMFPIDEEMKKCLNENAAIELRIAIGDHPIIIPMQFDY